MATQVTLKAALELSEDLLSDMELGTSPLTSIAMKASRLARLIGNFDKQQIMMYEAGGYPVHEPNTPERKEVARLARLAGRGYELELDGEVKKYVHRQSIELLHYEMTSSKEKMERPANSANRAAFERNLIDKMKMVAQRRTYIYEFVMNTYYELKFSAVASDVFDRARVKVDARLSEVVPVAIKKFSAVYENLLSSNEEDWSNAVHSCRRILQDTADAIYPAREPKVIEIGGKKKTINLGVEQYVNRLMAYVEENSSSSRFSEIVGSHLRYLGERLDAIFTAAQKGSHRVISSQEEADRCVIFTYLVVGDILQLQPLETEAGLGESLEEA